MTDEKADTKKHRFSRCARVCPRRVQNLFGASFHFFARLSVTYTNQPLIFHFFSSFIKRCSSTTVGVEGKSSGVCRTVPVVCSSCRRWDKWIIKNKQCIGHTYFRKQKIWIRHTSNDFLISCTSSIHPTSIHQLKPTNSHKKKTTVGRLKPTPSRREPIVVQDRINSQNGNRRENSSRNRTLYRPEYRFI